MVKHYKCPNCGADMAFDSHSGLLRCDSCGRTDNIETMVDDKAKAKDATISYEMDKEDIDASNSAFDNDYSDWGEEKTVQRKSFSSNDAKEYHCDNCGAVLITEAQTAATTCSFCGAGVVLSDRLSGTYAPDKVIPFSISKEQAQEAFRKWCRKGLLTPNDFKVADRVKSITGLYVPFWLYDMNGRGELEAIGTKVRTYTRGDWIYTETKYYNIYRKVDLHYQKVPCDASAKMDDTMMDKLEPFSYSNLKEFKMPYLAGYIAEKYDQDDNTLLPRIKKRITNYVDNYLHTTIFGYSSVSILRKNITTKQKNVEYALLPVWMVSYDYKKAEHNFIMNGQTGKIVGSPPISKSKVAGWFFGVFAASFLIMRIITLIMGGM